MKKLMITMLMTVLFGVASQAQLLEVRAYTGVNVHQFTNTDDRAFIDSAVYARKFSGHPGYQIGAAVTFGKRFYIQPGLQFTSVSAAYLVENAVSGEDLRTHSRLNMISVPLRGGFKLINPEIEDFFNLRIFGGIQGNHITSVRHTTSGEAMDNITRDDYSNAFFNADVGVGADLFFLFADVGYQFGISPVHSGPSIARSNQFYANLGVNFKF